MIPGHCVSIIGPLLLATDSYLSSLKTKIGQKHPKNMDFSEISKNLLMTIPEFFFRKSQNVVEKSSLIMLAHLEPRNSHTARF